MIIPNTSDLLIVFWRGGEVVGARTIVAWSVNEDPDGTIRGVPILVNECCAGLIDLDAYAPPAGSVPEIVSGRQYQRITETHVDEPELI